MHIKGLYFISDSLLSKKSIVEDCKIALQNGVKYIQYREKNQSFSNKVKIASKIAKLCKQYNACFIVNDSIELALKVDADGIHIGQDDDSFEEVKSKWGDKKIIGLSTHNIQEAIEAVELGVDYIGFGPIFKTNTKNNAGEQLGFEILKEVLTKVKIPIVPIGGLKLDHIPKLIALGASNAAIISDIIGHSDIAERICIIQKAFKA